MRLALELGQEDAETWNNLHEWGGRVLMETCMDTYNNGVGRGFAMQVADSNFTPAQLRQYVLDRDYQLQQSVGC